MERKRIMTENSLHQSQEFGINEYEDHIEIERLLWAELGYLSRLFDNTTNCYKFFWFQAILHKLDSTHSRFTFNELINEMIADAWYMVTEYHLRLALISFWMSDAQTSLLKDIYLGQLTLQMKP